ncbi:hypothetical protein BDZ89DRAFT_1011540 [Hymenopellis radicata]|nr:hypothetical protein BDZ89DRAFT_1011540 [Hymenopellis radicata]
MSQSSAEVAPLDRPVDASETFFSQILNPGSSLHPTFLLILDGSFALLLVVLILLLFMTRGNIHFIGLIGVELGLWGSVKWFVHELHNVHAESTLKAEEKKDL